MRARGVPSHQGNGAELNLKTRKPKIVHAGSTGHRSAGSRAESVAAEPAPCPAEQSQEFACRQRMKRKITGFHTDEEEHWVAELECGHYQHVRHNPPWIKRPWVITAEGRAHALGAELRRVGAGLRGCHARRASRLAAGVDTWHASVTVPAR